MRIPVNNGSSLKHSSTSEYERLSKFMIENVGL
jgi:hypothetical protein